MSERALPTPIGRIALPGDVRLWAVLIAAALATIVAGYFSSLAFAIVGAATLVVFAYVSFRTPGAVLVLLVFAPLVDRYLIRTFVPAAFQGPANLLSEGLLVVAAGAIFVHARASGRLRPALNHPVVVLIAVFVGLQVVAALLNGVRPTVAVFGILVTVDAFAVFVLARAVPYTERVGGIAAAGFVGLALVAAVLALGQVVLAPDILGLITFSGRFEEGLRPGAFFIAQPNMLGAVLGMAIPFAAFSAAEAGIDRRRRIVSMAALFVLSLALVYTFSRGTWLALAIALLVTGFAVDRRALTLAVATAVIAVVTAFVLPRGILLPAGSQWSIDIGNATLGRIGAISQGNDLRFRFIENALPIVEDHPLIGAGPGTYGGGIAARYGSRLYAAYRDGVSPADRTVDNYWLHVLVESGIVGTVLLLGAMGWVIRQLIAGARAARGLRRTLMAATATTTILLGVASVTEMLLEGNTTSFPLWFFVGLATLFVSRVPAPTTVVAAPAAPAAPGGIPSGPEPSVSPRA